MSDTLSIVVNIFVFIFALVGFLTSIASLFLIFYHRHRSPINTPMFLICNTYASILFVCIILIDMYVHYLYAELNLNISFNEPWCYIRAYFLHVGLCLLYHSFLLQAIFRFFRVIFYKYKQLQTIQFMVRLVLIQWLVDFLCMLPLYFLNYFHYIPQYYYCEILLNDNQGILLMSTITYSFPMIAMSSIYYYILYYMKKTKSQSIFLRNRQLSNQRDVRILGRILILVGLLIMLGIPTLIVWFVYVFTGYANPIGYRLGWALFTFSLSILPIASIFITPQLRELLIRTHQQNRRIQPTTITN